MAETDQRTCNSGTACKAHDGHTPYPTPDPLCHACLDHAQPEIRGLVYDYVDLAQLHEASMSQAITEKTSGGEPNSPMLLVAHIDELQAEIVHVTAMWEYELRVAHRLSDPRTFAPLWRRTVYDHLELTAGARQNRPARPGAIVQRAVGIIAHRVANLAALPETLVCPTGVEDEPVHMAGWEAVHQLQDLHRRCRSQLGRTRRITRMPGSCPGRDGRDCGGELLRGEPRDQHDPCDVYCGNCGNSWPYDDYSRFVGEMLALPRPEPVQ